MTTKREYRGVALWIVRDYLLKLGGTLVEKECVHGRGWKAIFYEGTPVMLGKLRYNTTHVDFEGDEASLKCLLAAFDLHMIRAGG